MKTLRLCILLLSFSPSLFSQWAVQTSPTKAYLYDVQFVDRQNGWVVGDSSVFMRTTDGGSSWTKQTLLGFKLYKVEFLNPRVGWAVGATSSRKGLILKTGDGGASWTVQDSSYQKVYMQSVSFVDSLHGWVVGSRPDTNAGLFRTTNGGTTWIEVDSPKIAVPNDIFFVDTLRGYAVGEYGGIVKTTDGGISWREVYRAIWWGPEPLRRVLFTTRDSGWAIGGISGVETKVRTRDGGLTWQISIDTLPGSSLHGLWFIDSKQGWTVGGANGGLVIEHTTDGGTTWTKQRFPFGPQDLNYFEAICMINPNEGWVVGDRGTILRTTNGGGTIATGVDAAVPRDIGLSQNYPNPFNPTTVISFQLPAYNFVTLKVFDVLGREVAMLVDGAMTAGIHSTTWNGRDDKGTQLSSGIYFYTLTTSDFAATKKMIMLK